MARYIDADFLLKRMFPYGFVNKKQYALNAQAVYNVIESSSTADVVEVVRCKDCVNWRRNAGFVDSPNGHCFYLDYDSNSCDFCSSGERK